MPPSKRLAICMDKTDGRSVRHRLCRDLKPHTPTHEVLTECEAKQVHFEGHVLETRQALPNPLKRPTTALFKPRASRSFYTNSVVADATQGSRMPEDVVRDVDHLKDLKNKTHQSDFMLPPSLVPQAGDARFLTARNSLQAAMKAHANITSFMRKARQTQSSSVQTTRFCSALVAVSDVALRVTTALTLGLGGACSHDPATGATSDPCVLFESNCAVISAASSPFHESAPRFLAPRTFIGVARRLARDELDGAVMSQVVPQVSMHLVETCKRVVEDEGENVCGTWFALSLITLAASDVRLHAILRAYGFSELDVAMALALSCYQTGSVGNRYRKKQSALLNVDDGATPWVANAESDDESNASTTEATSLEDAARAAREIRNRKLSKKTRRSSEACARSGSSRTAALIEEARLTSCEFTHFCFQQDEASSLVLFSDSDDASAEMGRAMLKMQIEEMKMNYNAVVAREPALESMSMRSAQRCRALLSGCFDQTKDASPKLTFWKDGAFEHSGTLSGNGDLPAHMLACVAAPQTLQSRTDTCRILWARATCALTSSRVVDDGPGALCRAARAPASTPRERAAQDGALQRLARRPLAPNESGLTRSVILLKLNILVAHDVLDAAQRVQRQVDDRIDGPLDEMLSAANAPSLLPSTVVHVGMLCQECILTELANAASKQSHLVVPLCTDAVNAFESKSDLKVEPTRRPSALLAATDLVYSPAQNVRDRPACAETEMRHCVELETTMAVTVAGDGATSVHAAIDLLWKLAMNDADPILRVLQWRSVLYMAGAQCNHVHQFAYATSSRENSVRSDATSKIESPDNVYNCFPTIHQAYVVGHNNLPELFLGTHWAGAYGCGYDCGAVASMGINAKNWTSDKRIAAVGIMEQADANELCEAFVESGVVDVGDKHVMYTPLSELGGLPRLMYPGVHAGLRGLHAAFETLRKLECGADVPEARDGTQFSIQVLPFSPFSQALPAQVTGASPEMGFRDVGCGWRTATGTQTPRPIQTLWCRSILNTPLFHGITASKVSQAHNECECIEPYVASVLVFASQLHEIERALKRLDFELNGVLRRFCVPDTEAIADAHTALLAADALVLINGIYPTSLEVGEACILEAVSLAPNAVWFRRARSLADVGASGADVTAAASFFDAVLDARVYEPLMAFVHAVDRVGGDFSSSTEQIQDAANKLEAMTRAAWYVHARGADRPPESSPLHCRASPAGIVPGDVNAVWVDRDHIPYANRRRQRGAVIGLPFAGPAQLLSLLTSAMLPGVKVQYFSNSGNMSLRVACCALKQCDGKALTQKGTSPVYSDNDALSFGGMDARKEQAKRQMHAWRENNKLIVSAARHFAFDGRADVGSEVDMARTKQELAANSRGGRVSTEERKAKDFLVRCAAVSR